MYNVHQHCEWKLGRGKVTRNLRGISKWSIVMSSDYPPLTGLLGEPPTPPPQKKKKCKIQHMNLRDEKLDCEML